MKAYRGTLNVHPSEDFQAEITDLTFDDKCLTLVLEATELRPEEPNWQIDRSLPWQRSVYRGSTVIRYDTGELGQVVDEPSPATITGRVSRVAAGLYVDLMIFQVDGDNGHEDKWHLTGTLQDA